MNKRHRRLTTALSVLVCALAGCASTPQDESPASVASVRVYGGSELAPSQYQVVSHVWANSSRTAARLPMYAKQEDAIVSVQSEAGRLGADGVINVVCLNQARADAEPVYLCYGTAIRVARNQ